MSELPSRDEALAALRAAEQVTALTDSDRRRLVRFTALLGLLVAALFVACWWTVGNDNTVGFTVVMLAYGAVLGALIWWQRRAQAAPRGFARVYGWGLGLTMALYAIGITWVSVTSRQPASPLLVLPYAALVALPCLWAAYRIGRIAR